MKMQNVKPLPVYPRTPNEKDMQLLRDAKKALKSETLIIPTDAVPGSPGRILALREPPPWLCDYALVKEPNVQSLTAALDWIINNKEDRRGVTIVRKLQEIFGPGVKEID